MDLHSEAVGKLSILRTKLRPVHIGQNGAGQSSVKAVLEATGPQQLPQLTHLTSKYAYSMDPDKLQRINKACKATASASL